ncbi:uncharacterized protein PV09_07963 [Verruconis gallopava]|uniref:Uncharacterized protein n=1 Tax=Verruconis gallopava TaxID=253628 RepID=A0A0D2AMT5_9PEZI|nr:uncharacterized protein PV09_07963 [Verruconis gallopava]KIW00434.1 hypothetical protein PV09_07963 [Verruconis gallopava]
MTTSWDKLGLSGSVALADFASVHNISSSQLNFTQECSQTVAFFTSAQYCSPKHMRQCDRYPTNKWYAVNSALPESVRMEQSKKTSNMSDLRLFWTYVDEEGVQRVGWGIVGLHHHWYDGFTNIALENGKETIDQMLEASLSECLPLYCQQAGFVGNPDITGIGAFISYIVIAALTTVVNFICMYLTWASTKPLDDPDVKSSRVWTATISASLSFLDTLLYANIMISVAGCLYHSLGKSVYEKSTSMLVADLAASATFSASILYRYSHEGMLLQIGLQTLPTLIRFFLVYSGINYMEATPLADSLCIGRPNFALSHLKTSFRVQMVLAMSILIISALAFFAHVLRSPRSSNTSKGASQLRQSWERFTMSQTSRVLWFLISVSLMGYMWMCLAFISQIRSKARYWFAKTYEDNEMGYGQIIAMGFCVQTVVTFIYELIVFKVPLRRTSTTQLLEPRPSQPSAGTSPSSTTAAAGTTTPSQSNNATSSSLTLTSTSGPSGTSVSGTPSAPPSSGSSAKLIRRSSSKMTNS